MTACRELANKNYNHCPTPLPKKDAESATDGGTCIAPNLLSTSLAAFLPSRTGTARFTDHHRESRKPFPSIPISSVQGLNAPSQRDAFLLGPFGPPPSPVIAISAVALFFACSPVSPPSRPGDHRRSHPPSIKSSAATCRIHHQRECYILPYQ
jgi:hypothetical protein